MGVIFNRTIDSGIYVLTTSGVKSKQQGSAITEMLAMATAFSFMFMAVTTIGKFADFNSTTAEANRFSTWEKAVLGDNAHVHAAHEDKLNRWVMSRSDDAITSVLEDRGDEEGYRNILWDHRHQYDQGGAQTIYTPNTDNLSINQYDTDVVGTESGLLMDAIEVVTEGVSLLAESDFDVNFSGLLRTNLAFNADTSGLVSGVGCEFPTTTNDQSADEQNAQTENDSEEQRSESLLCIDTRSAILTDTWAASGPDMARERVGGMVPTGWVDLAKVQTEAMAAFRVGNGLQLFEEAEEFRRSVGVEHIQIDRLPEDRLGERE